MWPKYLMKFKLLPTHAIVISVMALNLITAVGLRFRSLVKKSTVYSNADMRLAYQRSISTSRWSLGPR